MPFTQSQRLAIFQQLEVPQSELKAVFDCLEKTEKESELLVAQILAVLKSIETAQVAIATASVEDAGLIKADVLEWSEHRVCQMLQHKSRLQTSLANLTGYRSFHPVQNCF